MGCVVPQGHGRLFADYAMRIDSDLGGRSFAGSNSPHGFVRDGEFGDVLAGNSPQGIFTLPAQNIVGDPRLALFEDFADADNGGQSGGEGSL